jgi:cytochrome c biogenesis protein CcdA
MRLSQVGALSIQKSSLAYLALGVGLAVLLITGGSAVYRVQGGVSEIAPLLPFGYAYAAGMVAAVNPCGVLFLPSLAAYYVGGPDRRGAPWWARSASAVAMGLVATAGFLVLFMGAGLVFAVGGRALGAYFPVGGILAGATLAILGVWAILRNQPIGLVQASRAFTLLDVQRGRSILGLGIGYGVASLACTLPVFLAVVGTSLAGGGVHAASQFLGYSLGMGTIVTLVLLATAFLDQALTHLLRAVVPYVHGVGAAFLFAAGIYIVAYWLQALSL